MENERRRHAAELQRARDEHSVQLRRLDECMLALLPPNSGTTAVPVDSPGIPASPGGDSGVLPATASLPVARGGGPPPPPPGPSSTVAPAVDDGTQNQTNSRSGLRDGSR